MPRLPHLLQKCWLLPGKDALIVSHVACNVHFAISMSIARLPTWEMPEHVHAGVFVLRWVLCMCRLIVAYKPLERPSPQHIFTVHTYQQA